MSAATDHAADPSAPVGYHALVIDSGAIIKQTSLSSSPHSLLSAARHYFTVPAVLAEIRDPKSRRNLEEFKLRLQSLRGAELRTRTPTREGVAAVSEFARKTGDYAQLSGVDLQVLALLYDLEAEAANLYSDGNLDHVRREPKRVLGVSVKALNGDGKREVVRRERGNSVASGATITTNGADAPGASFFRGNADGIIDAAHVHMEYDNDDDDNQVIMDPMHKTAGKDEEREDASTVATNSKKGGLPAAKPRSWALLVNPERASTAPPVDYSIGTLSAASGKGEQTESHTAEVPALCMDLAEGNPSTPSAAPAPSVEGQFDDASEGSEEPEEKDDFSNASGSDGELDAIDIANAARDVDISDEDCDVFILEPHEAAYFKRLREAKEEEEERIGIVQAEERQAISSNDVGGIGKDATGGGDGLESEFPSLAAAAAVPYEGSDDETEELGEGKTEEQRSAWEREEEERKKKSLRPMVNGRAQGDNARYNSFRKYKNIVSADGSAAAMKQRKDRAKKEDDETPSPAESPADDDSAEDDAGDADRAYRSRLLGAAGAGAAAPSDLHSEMTEADDDGEGWVTSAADIRVMKSTGSLSLSSDHRRGSPNSSPRKHVGPPVSQRAACATTDFAMQNVILQMNLELLSVDGVRVRRLKTWVTRCAACYTLYGNDDKKKGGRLFCDRCGSDALQRIAASVDRNTGRLKLHMRKNYQHNTRGTKFALPKAGKANKYEGDLLLTEDQLLYGAWNQKLRKGKSKASGQSMFGSDLASDLGCRADLTKRDDIWVGFGRRNPNAAKGGRERRGKKKKGTKDKACGLRRY